MISNVQENSPQAGFTLLELLVVLVLAALTVAVVGGSAQAYMERARYHQTVRDVASLVVKARTLSLREGRSIMVTFDPASRRLIADGQWQIGFPETLQIKWSAMERGVGAAPSQDVTLFLFNTDGGAQGGSLSVLRAGHGVMFRVNWLLGSIEQTVASASP